MRDTTIVRTRGTRYHPAEWLTIEVRDGGAARVADAVTRGSPRGDIAVTSADDVTASGGYVTLTDRQHWILDQLRDGVASTRAMVEEHCGIGLRQAKRELAAPQHVG